MKAHEFETLAVVIRNLSESCVALNSINQNATVTKMITKIEELTESLKLPQKED